MHNVVVVKVGDGAQNFANDLCGILLGELSVLADAIEQFSASGKLRDDVVLVLRIALAK